MLFIGSFLSLQHRILPPYWARQRLLRLEESGRFNITLRRDGPHLFPIRSDCLVYRRDLVNFVLNHPQFSVFV
jgi:hypothetical protein